MNFRETMIVSGGLLAQQATVFATGILIARHLGAVTYGTLGTLKSLSSVLVIVTPLGLDLALLKHASFYHGRPRQLRTMSRALRLGVGAVNVLLLILVVLWLGPVLQGIYRDIPDFALLCAITMAGVVFATDVQISGALYRVFDRIVSYSVIVNYTQPCLRLAVSFAVLLAGGGIEALTWVNAAAFLYAFLAIATDERRFRARALPMPPLMVVRKAREILSESLWMAASLLVYQAIRLVDILILAALTTVQVTGEYAAMSSVAQLIQIYPMAISQTLGPRIALLYRQDDRFAIMLELRAYLRRASMLGGYLFGGVAVFGTDLDLVFGQSFSFSWPLASLLAFGWYVSAILAPFGYVLSMTGRHRQEVAILTAGAVMLVICLFALVPPLAAVGAALSVALVFVTVNVVRCACVVRVLSLNPLRPSDILPPLVLLAAAFACRTVGALLGSQQLVVLVAECVAYSLVAGGLYLAVGASSEERRSIGRFLPAKWRLS